MTPISFLFRSWPGIVFVVAGIFRTSSAQTVSVTEKAGAWELENDALAVTLVLEPGQMRVRHKASGISWSQSEATNPAARSVFRNPRPVQTPNSGLAFEATSGDLGTNLVLVTISLKPAGADIWYEVDVTDREKELPVLFPFRPLVLDSADASLVVADYSNGHIYALNSRPRNTWFNLWSIDMPWVGVCDLRTGQGYALVVETDDDAVIRLASVRATAGGGELWMPQAGFQPSHGSFRYPRRFFYSFSPSGGYVALAKRFRQDAKERGFLVPFSEKLKNNPKISKLFGAPDVWGNAGLRFAKEAKAAGVDKMLIHGRSPAAEMKQINELGYVTSEYDNYTDILNVEPGKGVDAQHGHLPDDAVLKKNNERMTAWLTWDKKQFMKRCPSLWVPAAKIVVPGALATHPFVGRFIDVTTAEELYECYDPKHLLTRSDKRRCGEELLGYVRSLGLVTGGEHGRYWAVPHLDYIEGMQSGGAYSWPAGWLKRPNSKDEQFDNPWGGKFGKWADYERWGIGHATRVPLWELVFHDCIVSTWYWGDSSDFLLQAAPEITPKKDAFNVLYGTIPLLWANKEGAWTTARETFLRSYRNTCKLHEVIAVTEMVSHEFLTGDRAVQRSAFSNGTEAVVNFGEKVYTCKSGNKAWELPQNGFYVTGPRIEQSLALVGGTIKTEIRAGDYHFSEAQKIDESAAPRQ